MSYIELLSIAAAETRFLNFRNKEGSNFMLKRIYIDNFKCLVNFEIKFEDNISLFLGANGSGKSTVYTALLRLKSLILGGYQVNQVFQITDLTRWENRLLQKIELDVQGNGGIYKYSLEIEHQRDLSPARLHRESLTFNAQPIANFSTSIDQGRPIGQATIYVDDPNQPGMPIPFDWSRSVVGLLPEAWNTQKLTWFKKWLTRLLIIHIDPLRMSAESRQEDPYPAWDMSNYAAWYSYLSGDQGKIFNLTLELRKILDGFDAFKNEPIGGAKVLSLSFPQLSKHPYKFTEISDGQRALIALYTLIYCAPDEDYTLCIDEPENFLALPEIQPWLRTLFDQCSDEGSKGQAIIISHHPALINYLASSSGYWFDRTDEGLILLQTITYEQDGGLSLARLIQLGWIYDE
ncbi:MAG: AAA family ATPase [Symploca sp. SIO2E6]|nr:AAA family ATPase [Symploca sp. SIO2E6]